MAAIQTLYLLILVRSQLHLRTLFLPPEGVRLQELQPISLADNNSLSASLNAEISEIQGNELTIIV